MSSKKLDAAVQPTLRLGVELAGLLSQPARASPAIRRPKLAPLPDWRGFCLGRALATKPQPPR